MIMYLKKKSQNLKFLENLHNVRLGINFLEHRKRKPQKKKKK